MPRSVFALVLLAGLTTACTEDPGPDPCVGFASGSLTDDALVPSTRNTALGIRLVFDSIADDELDMSIVCTSNSEILFSGPVDLAGLSTEVEVEFQPYRIEFAWVPDMDVDMGIEYSVALDEIE